MRRLLPVLDTPTRVQDFPASLPFRPSLLVPGASSSLAIEPAVRKLVTPKYLEPMSPVSFRASMRATVFGQDLRKVAFKRTLKLPMDMGAVEQWHDSKIGSAEEIVEVNVAGKYTLESIAYLDRNFTLLDLGKASANFEVVFPSPGIWDFGWARDNNGTWERVGTARRSWPLRAFSLFSPSPEEEGVVQVEFAMLATYQEETYMKRGNWSTYMWSGQSYASIIDIQSRYPDAYSSWAPASSWTFYIVYTLGNRQVWQPKSYLYFVD